MGIYSNCENIYGIEISTFDNNNNIIFKKQYDEPMNDEQMREAYLFYDNLSDDIKLYIWIYTECCSTLDPNNKDTFMDWYSISLSTFLQKFEPLKDTLDEYESEIEQRTYNGVYYDDAMDMEAAMKEDAERKKYKNRHIKCPKV